MALKSVQKTAWGNTVKVEWLQGPAGQEAGFEWGQVEGASSSHPQHYSNSSANPSAGATYKFSRVILRLGNRDSLQQV
jgi:hypothetical protein